ncbi:MAG: divalent-cation tolerance protein CutA [Legionellaceae bacterium]|nr:divalent-cation tolerance protein CutA [Legionellaceae bacterium]
MRNKISLIYTTMASIEEAERLAEKAIEAQYASCVNIIPQIKSIYRWEGNIEKSAECVLLFKTSTSMTDQLLTYIENNHPYSVPAILHTTVETSADFFAYIEAGIPAV